jgi:hypothetical protein
MELVLEVKDLAPVRRVNGVTWERVELLTEFLAMVDNGADTLLAHRQRWH